MYIYSPAGYGGYHPVYARGTASGLPQHTVAMNLAVEDFTATPVVTTASMVNHTGSTMFQWAITPLGGFSGNVAASRVTIDPSNAWACNIYPVTNWGTDNVTLSLTSTGCQAGTYNLSVILLAATSVGN